MLKIMLSSTYTDLAEHRRITIEALRNLQQHVVAMEFFYAKSDTPKETSIQQASEADIYVGIIGWRYGSIDPETGKSITQLEYEVAGSTKKPCLIFLQDPEYPTPAKHVDRGEAGQKLEEFRRLLQEKHTCGFFRGPKDLAIKVLGSLRTFLPDPDKDKLRRNGYWDTLDALYMVRDVKDLAPRFDASHDDLWLLTEIEGHLVGLDKLYDSINDSYDRMESDLKSLLARLNVDERELDHIPYYENPFVNRDWEIRILGLSNWPLHIRGALKQLKVRLLEREAARDPGNDTLRSELEKSRNELKDYVEKAVIVD